jgi:hypothetical protein
MNEPTGRLTTWSAGEPTKNRYIVLAIVMSAVFMGVLDSNVVYLALHKITGDFGVDLLAEHYRHSAHHAAR